MADRDPNADCRRAERPDQSVTYRCVCGEMVSCRSGAVACSSCGRRYDSEVLRDATAATMKIDRDGVASDEDMSIAVGERDEFVGRKLGQFQILDRLGRGGMGAVYRALDESLQRYVAVKVLRHAVVGPDDSKLQQMFQEARAQARVNHPHVAHIYYVGCEVDTPYLAMELVGSETLADRLKDGPLPYHMMVRFARQIAEALAAAAKFDIVHGDVKPANVLLVDGQTLKLSDFGLARRLSEASDVSGVAAGTPDYIAPEAVQGREIDHRGDMYSLGVTLFQMTFGRLPYTPTSNEVEERLRLHCSAPAEFPVPWPTEFPQGWHRVLQRLLEKEPGNRYADYGELIADLRQLEPTTLPTASPLLRGFAWLFDGFLVSMPLAIIALIFQADPFTIPALAGTASAAAVTLGFCALQASWGTTPGKRLFQIRIVDEHGLPPPKSVLGPRAAFQFALAWAVVAIIGFQHLALKPIGPWTLGLAVSVMLVEMGLVIFGKGRSLHDRILGTRVVLDALSKPSE